MTDGGAVGANVDQGLTNGGRIVPNGGSSFQWRRPGILTALAFFVFGLVYVAVNASSLIDERQALGQPIAQWQPWVLELTSFVAWLCLVPFIIWLAERAILAGRPVLTIVIHVLVSVPVSLFHGGAMYLMRELAYRAMDEKYRSPGAVFGSLLYEYRKDAVTYASILIVFLLLKRIVEPPPYETTVQQPALIEVRDGTQTIWMKPDEIEWIEAAGNYVELHGIFGTKLARRTLSDIEAELVPHGFVRIHRSRLVGKHAILKMETRQSGDFEMTLRSGTTLTGSRRFRANI